MIFGILAWEECLRRVLRDSICLLTFNSGEGPSPVWCSSNDFLGKQDYPTRSTEIKVSAALNDRELVYDGLHDMSKYNAQVEQLNAMRHEPSKATWTCWLQAHRGWVKAPLADPGSEARENGLFPAKDEGIDVKMRTHILSIYA